MVGEHFEDIDPDEEWDTCPIARADRFQQ